MLVHEFWYDHSMKCFVFPTLPYDTHNELIAQGFAVREDVRGFLVTVVGDSSSFRGVLEQSPHIFLGHERQKS